MAEKVQFSLEMATKRFETELVGKMLNYAVRLAQIYVGHLEAFTIWCF